MSDYTKITHAGEWIIDEKSGLSIDCYVTEDQRRLLSLRGTARTMGLKGAGSTALVRNLGTKWIEPYLTEPLLQWLEDVKSGKIEKVSGVRGREFIPFDGELFVDLCKAYINAQKDGVFEKLQNGGQDEIADRLLSVMSAFAKVGIVALIDEVTGYQDEREKDDLQKLLAAYVREEFLPWTRRFPESFYIEMFRLKGWEYRGNAKSPLVGKLTNKLVYEMLPESILEELQKRNPPVESGRSKIYRKHKHHQFLTESTGIAHLDKHLVSVITLMQVCETWDQFEILFGKLNNLSTAN